MEASSVRSRYTGRRPAPRRSAPGGGYSRNSRDSGLRRLVTFQALICTLLFFIVIIAKNVNISAANFLTDQIRYTLSHNIELKSVFAYVETLAADIVNSIVPGAAQKNGVDIVAVSDTTLERHKDASSGIDSTLGTTSTMNTPPTSSMPPTSSTPPTADSSPDEAAIDSLYPVGKSVLAANTDSTIVPDMLAPVVGTLTTPFGEIQHGTSSTKTHTGIDIHTEKESSVKAVMDGEITETGSSPLYGDYIKMRHDKGFETVYAHCRIIIVQKGDIINEGDVIAQIGDQNISAGNHLHFEVWKDGEAVNPLEYISVAIR